MMRGQQLVEAIEQEFGEPLPDVLRGFADMGLSKNATAEAVGVKFETLARWAKRYQVAFTVQARPPLERETREKIAARKRQGRRKDARMLTFEGRTMHLSAWAREVGLSPQTLHKRLFEFKMPLERALHQRPHANRLKGMGAPR